MRRMLSAGAGLVMVVSGALLALPASAADGRPDGLKQSASTKSAVTKSGSGEFADLKVTVGQTRDLVNQIVAVTWTGGKPTMPEFGNLNTNYLQIMQCWGGTAEDGPPREQCQYGALKSGTGGQNTNSRQMTTAGVTDPLEDQYEENAEGTLAFIPFDSWTGKRTTGAKSEFFDRNTSNESNHNRTRSDGTGQDYFEIQTGVEAPGLGCGQTRDGETPLCWLVVVPRGETEVDGTARNRSYTDPLDTSPLMASNWANRIVFPLEFQPVGAACAFGASEVPLLGSERMAEAVTRWQPALCSREDINYSFTVLPDDAVRSKLTSAQSDLGFVTYGVPADQVDPQRPIVYAPVALSGMVIAFNVESQSSTLAPDEVRARDGSRMEGIRLNPRLVAKVLTQTYRYDAEPQPGNVAKNPFDLAQDPEFLALNPQFEGLKFPGLAHVLTTADASDSARMLWEYIWSDKDARAFLNGKADPWGTTLNTAYAATQFPRSDFPREDNQCRTYSNIAVPVCTFDLVPYANSIYEAARAASRGDSLARGVFDPAAVPPGWKRSPVQEPGRRSMIAVTDSPLTQRFSLTPAALLNAAGEYVAPTTQSLRAAAAAAVVKDAPGVRQPDMSKKVPGAYPLATYTYAATTPATLSRDAGAAYADLIDYAVGAGQELGEAAGQLPRGYVPLNDRERAIAIAAAETIRTTAGKKPTPSPSPTPSPTATPTPEASPEPSPTQDTPDQSGSTGETVDSSGTSGGYVDTSVSTSTTTETVVEETTEEVVVEETTEEVVVEEVSEETVVDQPATQPVAAQALMATPAQPVGAIRYLAVVLLLTGGSALLAGAVVAQRGRRRTTP